MRRSLVVICVLTASLLPARPADSALYYGFIVGVANAPPPPAIRLTVEPHAVRASDAMVYVVDDAALLYDGDLFHYGQYWFAYSRGYWYRGRSHRGPFATIDVRKVPRAIIGVPRRLWKHHPLAAKPTDPKRPLAGSRATQAAGSGTVLPMHKTPPPNTPHSKAAGSRPTPPQSASSPSRGSRARPEHASVVSPTPPQSASSPSRGSRARPEHASVVSPTPPQSASTPSRGGRARPELASVVSPTPPQSASTPSRGGRARPEHASVVSPTPPKSASTPSRGGRARPELASVVSPERRGSSR